MHKVFITRLIPDQGIKLLKKHKNFQVKVSPHDRVLKKAELKKAVRGCDAILSLLTDWIDGEIMDAAGPQLKIIANYAVGFDNIDLKAAKKRGIIVANAPCPEISESVAEHTFALMIALAHRIVEADKFTRAEKYKGWEPLLLLGEDLKGKILGIIGLGRIGQNVARIAVKGFGMKVLYFDVQRNPQFEKEFHARYFPLNSILPRADFLTLHIPLLRITRHLIGPKQFKLMKKTVYLINTSRGPVVDEKALLLALTKKQIAGAALDVYECEPLIDCDLTDNLALKKFFNVILTPHTASATVETRQAMGVMAAKNIIAVLGGKKPLTPAK